jgi:hypothetical protein
VKSEIEILVKAVRGSESPPDLRGLNWPRLLRVAAANKVLWPLVERLDGDWHAAADLPPGQVDQARRQGQAARERGERTLELLLTTLDEAGIYWRVLKTARGIDNIPTDVDVVIPAVQLREACRLLEHDPRIVQSRLRPRGASDPMGEDKVSYAASAPNIQAGLAKLDLHRSLAWHGRQCIAAELAFAGSHMHDVVGVSVPVPPAEVELLATAASLFFDRRAGPLADLLWMEHTLYQPIDWELVSGELDRWGWLREFASFMALAAALAEHVLGEPPPLPEFVTQNARPVPGRARRQSLPMPYPLGVRHDLRLLRGRLFHKPATAIFAFCWHRYRALRERLTRGRVTGFGAWYHPGR